MRPDPQAQPFKAEKLTGSVNLADAGSVMREIVARVPSGLRRIPDGENGDRGNWIFFQMQRFLQSSAATSSLSSSRRCWVPMSGRCSPT